MPNECRRCVECLGEPHHWIEASAEALARDELTFYECKHCDATTGACADCLEAVPPGDDLCDECAEEYDAEDCLEDRLERALGKEP